MDYLKIHLGKNILRLQDRMEMMLDEFFNQSKIAAMMHHGAWRPSMDVYETQTEIIILMDLAGVAKEDITIVVDETGLRVNGVRRDIQCDQKIKLHQMEIDFGPFERHILVRIPFKADGIKAAYDQGFLRIEIPKAEKQSGPVEISTE